jgi:hypothetical protein
MNADESHRLFLDEEDEPASAPPYVAPRPPAAEPPELPAPRESSGPPAALGQPAPPTRLATAAEILAALQRVEKDLGQIRGLLDASVREERHRDFSLARLLGSAAQALMVGLLLWIVSDWVFGEPRDVLTLKVAFAAVLQLVALTAFLVGREKG